MTLSLGADAQLLILPLMNALMFFRDPARASLVHINASLMAGRFPLSLYLLVFWLLPSFVHHLLWDSSVLQRRNPLEGNPFSNDLSFVFSQRLAWPKGKSMLPCPTFC